MPKSCFGFSLKNGALVMAFINIFGGLSQIIGGIVEIVHAKTHINTTIFIVCIALGIIAIFDGFLLLYAMINANERLILLYVLLGSANLFIITVFSGINMFEYQWLVLLFFLTNALWYGQYCMYSFYEEVSSYNKVSSGVVEVSYEYSNNNNNTGLINESYENTAV